MAKHGENDREVEDIEQEMLDREEYVENQEERRMGEPPRDDAAGFLEDVWERGPGQDPFTAAHI